MHRDFFGSQMEDNPWLEVSMPEGFIKGVEIVTRWGCCADRVKNIEFRAGRESVPIGFKGRLTSNTQFATFFGVCYVACIGAAACSGRVGLARSLRRPRMHNKFSLQKGGRLC